MSTETSSQSSPGQAGGTPLDALLAALGNAAGPGIGPLVSAREALPEVARKLGELQHRYSQQHMQLWLSIFTGGRASAHPPLVAAHPGDRRFVGADWTSSPFFDYLRQSYLLNTRFVLESIDALGLDGRNRDRLNFAARQIADAMSPANFAATNPEALKLAIASSGASLAEGLRNFLQDAQKGRISTTDESMFEIGKNVATTKGAVVFRNELIELIQYSPVTSTVYERPLLMVPPSINKYYILDLQPGDSFVHYALEQGHTVFMISWRNVQADQSTLTWDDYLELGVLQAISVVREITRCKKINTLGFCVGGTLLASALAVMAARKEDSVESLTLLAAMLDYSDTGEIGLFVDEASVASREGTIGKGGLMPGRELAFVFSALRANDLVWSYVVNNYLKGRRPEAFDLLYWNADSTNLPGPMYCWYVRNLYLNNSLRVPGKLSMLGQPVDLGRLRMPAYVLGTREDHIVPWRSAYRSMDLLRGERRFVLGASGHIAGVINPARKNRRSFWKADAIADAPDAWLATATEHAGSWWSDWSDWQSQYGGRKRKAKKRLGGGACKVLEPAPGSYVKQRLT